MQEWLDCGGPGTLGSPQVRPPVPEGAQQAAHSFAVVKGFSCPFPLDTGTSGHSSGQAVPLRVRRGGNQTVEFLTSRHAESERGVVKR